MPRPEVQRAALAARLYHEEDRTQAEIARILGVSRPTVSRLLQAAKAVGIVQIKVVDPWEREERLVRELCERTALRHALVVPGQIGDPVLMRTRLGKAAAGLLEETLTHGDVVGVGWGRTLRALVEALEPAEPVGLEAVPLLGGLGQIAPDFQVHELAGRLAQGFGGASLQLYVPAIIEDPKVRGGLLSSPDVEAVLRRWDEVTVAILGIGNVDLDRQVQMLFGRYLDEQARRRLHETGAVGDICMRFYDAAGRPVPEALPGVVSVELEQLHRVPRVLAVAGGLEKAAAILGAVRGGYVDTLVIDEPTARAVLELEVGGRGADERRA